MQGKFPLEPLTPQTEFYTVQAILIPPLPGIPCKVLYPDPLSAIPSSSCTGSSDEWVDQSLPTFWLLSQDDTQRRCHWCYESQVWARTEVEHQRNVRSKKMTKEWNYLGLLYIVQVRTSNKERREKTWTPETNTFAAPFPTYDTVEEYAFRTRPQKKYAVIRIFCWINGTLHCRATVLWAHSLWFDSQQQYIIFPAWLATNLLFKVRHNNYSDSNPRNVCTRFSQLKRTIYALRRPKDLQILLPDDIDRAWIGIFFSGLQYTVSPHL